MTLLFFILLFLIFGKLIRFGFKATWGITKAVFFIMILPLLLVGMVLGGMIYIAMPILLVVGFVSLLKTAQIE